MRSGHARIDRRSSGEAVLRREIVVGRLGDGLRWGEAALLPVEAPVDHPLQDARPLVFELVAEVRVALVLGDDHGEDGIMLTRRRIASPTLRRPGLWLPVMTGLN